MKRFISALVLLAVVALPAAADTYRATLTGDREPSPGGDPNGFGYVFLVLDGTTVSYYLMARGIGQPTASHIHVGPPGTSGSVVVGLASSFTQASTGAYVASGSVELDATLANQILMNPANYYVNIHTTAYPGGAIRGALIGDGGAVTTVTTSGSGDSETTSAYATTLLGRRESPAGDPTASGFAGVLLDGSVVYYYLWSKGLTSPTASHIHQAPAGQPGSIVVDLHAAFTNGVAFGNVTTDGATAAAMRANPGGYYVNIHTPAFPGGAIRGQLQAPETQVFFPVVTSSPGLGGSNFKTDLRIQDPMDEDATVWAQFYPANSGGMAAPSQSVKLAVVTGGMGVFDDMVQLVFGVTGNGALRLVSDDPIEATARIYNDQRSNPAVMGTFGQDAPGLELSAASASGSLLLLSNRPVQDATGYRTNVIYFNPWPTAVQATFTAVKPDGTALGSATVSLAPHANAVTPVFSLVSGVPAGQTTQDNFFVTFTASAGIFINGSVVDNKTGDPTTIEPVWWDAVPAPATGPTPTPTPTPSATPTPPGPTPTPYYY
jgi:hypothetical protein